MKTNCVRRIDIFLAAILLYTRAHVVYTMMVTSHYTVRRGKILHVLRCGRCEYCVQHAAVPLIIILAATTEDVYDIINIATPYETMMMWWRGGGAAVTK